MSGVEVAGLVFGVLPIIFEAIRAYSAVSDGLHTFRHWSREVDRVSEKLKTQEGIFRNECRLLLRLVEDGQVADDMMKDNTNLRWTNKATNAKLKSVLKDNVELCCSIIKEVRGAVVEMTEEMQKFEVLRSQKQKVSTLCCFALRK